VPPNPPLQRTGHAFGVPFPPHATRASAPLSFFVRAVRKERTLRGLCALAGFGLSIGTLVVSSKPFFMSPYVGGALVFIGLAASPYWGSGLASASKDPVKLQRASSRLIACGACWVLLSFVAQVLFT
jgi:hypothetical protein